MHTLEQLRAGKLCGARHLKLCENLTEFPLEILSLKETLEVLDLTGNQLSTLPDELAGFGKLRIIFCSENRFTELPEVLGRCPALTMVGFKANRITTVSARALPAGLRWLILTDNAIEQLPDTLAERPDRPECAHRAASQRAGANRRIDGNLEPDGERQQPKRQPGPRTGAPSQRRG